jgi:hypothetical protein
MKAILAETFAKNTFAYLPGPYHFRATFETFTRDGKLDGKGSIEKFFASPGHLKVIRSFRDHTSTEYFNGGPPSYTDDGSEGSIMSYFANNFLLFPLPPPTGTARKDLEASTMQIEGSDLDCGMFQLYVSPPPFPSEPKEALCVSRPDLDLEFTQTLVFSVHYQSFAPFLGRSIPRDITAYEGSVVRCRIHMEQVDQQALDDEALAPPANGSLVKPGPEWRSTTPEEDSPKRLTLASGMAIPQGDHAAAYGEFLVLRSRTGAVIDVQPIYAPKPELAQTAADALKQWIFRPLVRQGEPVETISTVHLAFDMH